jgi:hypothetical protein
MSMRKIMLGAAAVALVRTAGASGGCGNSKQTTSKSQYVIANCSVSVSGS